MALTGRVPFEEGIQPETESVSDQRPPATDRGRDTIPGISVHPKLRPDRSSSAVSRASVRGASVHAYQCGVILDQLETPAFTD